MMKLKFGLNLNSILFIFAVVFSITVIVWLVFRMTRVTEGLTEYSAKAAYDSANAKLQQLTNVLDGIESANKIENKKYETDKTYVSIQITSQTIKVDSQKLVLDSETSRINFTAISPNIGYMKKQYDISNGALIALKEKLDIIESDHINAVDKYIQDKGKKPQEIKKQRLTVNKALIAYNQSKPPTIKLVTAADKKVFLSISPVVGTIPDGYTVTYGTPRITKKLKRTTDEKYTIDGLKNGTEYIFSVSSNFKKNKKSSPVVSVAVTPKPVLSITSLVPGDGKVTITIESPSVTSYTITSSPGNIVKSNVKSPYIFEGLTNGTPYTFAVVNDGNKSESIKSERVTPRSAVKFTINDIKKDNVTVNITNDNPNVKGYRIYNGNKTQYTTSKTYIFKGLTKDTEYTFTLSTLYKDNVVKTSLPVTIKTLSK